MIKKITNVILRNKIVFGTLVPLIAIGGYFGINTLKSNTVETRYVLAAVQKETLVTSVSGSGQISVSDQLDIKPKVSGDIVNVGVEVGQEVETGTLLVQIDNKDAQKNVKDAQTALETAQLDLNKLTAPPSDLDVLKAENDLTTAKNNLDKLLNPDKSALSQSLNALTSAQDSLTKLKSSQVSNYQDSLDARQKAEDNITKGYENAYNTITDIFLDLPNTMSGLDDVLHGYEICDNEVTGVGGREDNTSALMSTTYVDFRNQLWVSKTSAENDYTTARAKYDAVYADYENISDSSDQTAIDSLLNEAVGMVKAVTQAAKSENTYLGTWVDFRTQQKWTVFSEVTSYQKDLSSYLGTVNSDLSKILSAQNSVQDNFDALKNAETDLKTMEQNQPLDLAAAERTVQEKEDALDKLKNPDPHDVQTAQIAVKEKELALEDLKAGADALDIRAKKITIQQKADALAAARESLADYNIQIPFDGVIAKLNVKKGDTVSSGTAIATLVTKQRIAEISLNEVDAAKVKVGQKVTLTFDAVSDLSLTGEVAEIDTLGTVTQGVVTYNLKIVFDTQDERVKPGMSVSASIVTDLRSDVLTIPNGAVKSSGAGSYVELPDETVDQAVATSASGVVLKNPLRQQLVQVGEANDSSTEITDGLNEGDLVVIRTVSPTTAATTSTTSQSQNRSLFGGGDGSVRFQSGGGMPRD